MTDLGISWGRAESVTGDELLAEAYNLRQQDNEEVAAFASRLDNQVILTKLRQCELLPDDNAVDKHLRILFWAGLRQGIKDKARHKKDQCKTFGELITAARYGEKEANNSTQAPKRVSRSNPVQQVPQGTQDKKPSWVNEMCTSFSREVREVLKEGIQKKEVVNHNKPNEGQSNNANYSRYSEYLNEDGKPKKRQPVRCYRCGQIGHIQVGCRNKPLPSRQGNEQRPPNKGLQGRYRSFVKNFASIAEPLYQLVRKPNRKADKKLQQTFEWSSACQNAFERLIEKLTSPPILTFDFQKPFIVHTDASGFGIGAALYQIQDDQPK
ncbi:hypothetical protein QZH41_019393, partial [Actinostola sp. cb2023]